MTINLISALLYFVIVLTFMKQMEVEMVLKTMSMWDGKTMNNRQEYWRSLKKLKKLLSQS